VVPLRLMATAQARLFRFMKASIIVGLRRLTTAKFKGDDFSHGWDPPRPLAPALSRLRSYAIDGAHTDAELARNAA